MFAQLHGEVLLSESSGSAVPVAALVQALVPDSRVQVPATRQTDWLLRALPLPDVQAGDAQSAPHARLARRRRCCTNRLEKSPSGGC